MRRLGIRILIAVLTFTAGVAFSKLLNFPGAMLSESSCKKPRVFSTLTKKKLVVASLSSAPSHEMDAGLLQPSDAAYVEAREFAEILRDRGINVHSIQRSKLEGLFSHSDRAAFFRTDRGIVEVIFLSGLSGFESADAVRVNRRRMKERYLNSFRGHETQPFYFVNRRDKFIVTRSHQLANEIELAL